MKGSVGPWEYTLCQERGVNKDGEEFALVVRDGRYRLPKAVFEVEPSPHGPWFLETVKAFNNHVLSILRMSEECGFIPIISRCLVKSDKAIRVLYVKRIAVPVDNRKLDLRNRTHSARAALALLVHADDGEQRQAIIHAAEVLSALPTENMETIQIEIAILQFPAANETMTSGHNLLKHPAILIPQQMLGSEEAYIS
jgi:hypothetical protein